MRLGRIGRNWVLGSCSVLALAVFVGTLSSWCPIRLHNYLYVGNQAGECAVEEGSAIEFEGSGYIAHFVHPWKTEDGFACRVVVEHLGPFWETNHLAMRDLADRLPPGAQAIEYDSAEYEAQFCSQQSFLQKFTGQWRKTVRNSSKLFQ
jgi:hypothetical protein